MQADGSGRRSLGDYGRPKWSPESRQFLIASFSTPAEVTIMDVRPERSGVLNIPDHKVYSVPNWAGEGTLVAVIGAGAGDAIALIDVTDPAQGKVKEVLWKRGKELDVQPFNPVYSPVTRQCVFVGKTEGKGRALYSFHHGKPDRPARLEPGEQFDNLIQDPAFSPDGRYIVFSGDRKPSPCPTAGRGPGAVSPAPRIWWAHRSHRPGLIEPIHGLEQRRQKLPIPDDARVIRRVDPLIDRQRAAKERLGLRQTTTVS